MNKDLRTAIWLAADGISDASGAPLEDGQWQIDHIVPRAAGGTDDVGNLRATTTDENRSKSDALPPSLRQWQEAFVRAWLAATTADFTLVALPGSGKTVAALSVAQAWVEAEPTRRRVLIVVPTDPLRTQWKEEAAQSFGLQFQTKEFYTFKTQYQGGIVTYSLVASQPMLFKKLCSTWDVLVICDEIHHAGPNDWGVMLREAIAPAARRLLMSGTPFRGDRKRIPFVSYDGLGLSVADYRYDYPSAISDGVIRIVRFQHDKGIVRRISPAGVEETPELRSDVAENECDELLRSLLTPGHFTETLLRNAHDKLMECRHSMPNAGGLALCIDQTHAERIARQLTRLTGEPPALIVSDDDRATSTVHDFRASTSPWVVAVRQISEGVDIKRLMVLAYLTTTRSELFFRQAVGRIVRNMGTENDMEAYCFIPDHPALVRSAQNIVNAQAQAVEEEPAESRERKPNDRQQSSLWPTVLGTEHTGSAGSIIEGERLTPERAASVQKIARESRCSEQLVWRVMQNVLHASPPVTGPPSAGVRSHMRPLEDQTDDLRRGVLKACQRAAYRLADPPDFKHTNYLVNQHVGKARALFTLDDCRTAIAFADTLGVVELES